MVYYFVFSFEEYDALLSRLTLVETYFKPRKENFISRKMGYNLSSDFIDMLQVVLEIKPFIVFVE